MPKIADLLTTSAQDKLRRRYVPEELPDIETLEAERLANLARIAAERQAALLDLPGVAEALGDEPTPMDGFAALAGELEAEEAEAVAMLPKEIRKQRQAELSGWHDPDATDTDTRPRPPAPKEDPVTHAVNLSHLSDAQLGRMVRAALLTLVVDELPAQLAEALGQREQREADRHAVQDKAIAERKAHPERWIVPGFTVGTVEIPQLDLRSVILDEVAPAKARSPYNRALYKLGQSTLDPESCTWQTLHDVHTRLGLEAVANGTPLTPVAVVAVDLDPSVKAKAAALVDVLGISEAEAIQRVQELSAH